MRRKGILTSLILAMGFTIFSPFANKVQAAEKVTSPSIAGTYAVTIDYETGELIYTKGIDEKAYPASTTKMLTALIFAENKEKSDTIPYTADALKQPAYNLNTNQGIIKVGDTMTADDVMKALLLFSANDSAYMIADSVAGDSKSFEDMMNKKIADLNLKNTHFVTPNGLHDSDHYTTAYDLSVIAKEAFHNDWVRETMATDKATIEVSNGKTINLENRNRFVGQDGNIGGKTGYTSQAGRCLVAIYERSGRKLIGVVLNSAYDAKDETVFNDMKKIMDYSYSAEKETYLKAGEQVDKVKVDYKPFRLFGPTKTIEVPLVLQEDVTYYNNEINKKEIEASVKVKNLNAWQLASNKDAAKLDVKERVYSKEYSLKANLSTSSLIKANLLLYFVTFIVIILILALALFIVALIKRGGKRRRRKRIF